VLVDGRMPTTKGQLLGPRLTGAWGLTEKKFFEFLKSRSLLHDDAVISFASLSERRHREGQQLDAAKVSCGPGEP
jgi:hypothetical protein